VVQFKQKSNRGGLISLWCRQDEHAELTDHHPSPRNAGGDEKKKKISCPQVSEWKSLGYYSLVSSLNFVSQDPSCEEQTNRVIIQPDLAAMGLGMMRG
jgi:hypothetical protein